VIPTTSISRPQLKSNQLEDRAMLNNSQGKKPEVEDHCRNVNFSKNKTSVTACNDSLKAKNSNVNFVCVTCRKCVLNGNHDMCALHYLNGVNSRTKMPMVVPISIREPKCNVKQYVSTNLRRTVALESTNQKPRHTIRKIYEHVSKACSWWYPKFTPPRYKWKPKSQIGNVNMPLVNAYRTANILEPMTPRCSNVSNTTLYSNSIAPRRDNPIHRRLWVLKAHDEKCSHGIDLYSITLQDKSSHNPIYLMAKATLSQAWLWHRRLSHLNFNTINLLLKIDIFIGLPKLKFVKDHLCSSCELGKAKRKSFPSKTTPSSKRRLQLLHMDLCGPMRVESINGKKYVPVIVDDYSRYTWTHFLRSKYETPKVLIDFLRLIQRGLHAQVRTIRTYKGTEFLNKTLHAYFAAVGIDHQTFVARTPKQNGIVKRMNRIIVEAAQTMLTAAKVPLDGENLDKMKEKGNACIFVGYLTQSRAYMVFNKRTRVIVKTIHVNFHELPQMASDHVSSDPVQQCPTTALEHESLSPGPQSRENVTKVAEIVTTSNELDLLFSQMFDELFNGSTQVVSKSSAVTTVDAPNKSKTILENAQVEDDEFINIFCTLVQDRGKTSSRHFDSSDMHTFYQRHPSEHRWTKDHSLEQVIGNPSQSVRTRRQLELDGEMCMFALFVSRTKPKTIKESMADSVWIESMQEELHQFDRLDSPVIHQPPQELSIQEMEDPNQQYLDELKRLSNLEYRDEVKIAELTQNFNEDEHLDTILATESDEFIKSSVENLVLIPSESEDESECDMPDCDDSQTTHFSTFSNPLFDDFTSSDDESSHEEDIHEMSFKTYSNPLFDLDDEIISSEFNPIHNEDLENNHFDTEPYLLESLPNRNTLMSSLLKIDSLLAEFVDAFIFLKSIPLGIDKADCDLEEDIHLVERLLYDNSSPRPPKEFNSENYYAKIESFSPSPIPIEDSDSHMEEINLSFNPDDPMPSGIEEDDDDSERDILILKELLDNYSLLLPTNESCHFDIPSPYHPPAKPPDGNTKTLNIKMLGDVSDQKVPIHNHTIIGILNQEKSPDLFSHLGLEAIQPSAECPMIINGKNTHVLDVPLFHFYPLDQLKYGGN
nr:retrovirus-related Pol polyprotein from transposon TNT 1-94 [Tanacetum cinerariifolium]